MRLLNVETLQLREFIGSDVPSYAILSHRWEDEEVTFDDMRNDMQAARQKQGFAKITSCCEQAQADGFEYIWIDTCCIDKSSSAELSEAINSMFQWYKRSSVCYAYLSDVQPNVNLTPKQRLWIQSHFSANQSSSIEYAKIAAVMWNEDSRDDIERFQSSLWFKRGWTLQELIAPSQLFFYGQIDGRWFPLGDRSTLIDLVADCTGVDVETLGGRDIRYCSVAARMSWAANRITTREEDIAYCLLGIFDVNMPLLYGEGAKAFIRLQEEIMKSSDDQSLFAWNWYTDQTTPSLSGLLASTPQQFQDSAAVIPIPQHETQNTYAMTNRGLRIELPLIDRSKQDTERNLIAVLQCQDASSNDKRLGVSLLRVTEGNSDQYARNEEPHGGLVTIPSHKLSSAILRTIYIKEPLDVKLDKRPGVYIRLGLPDIQNVAMIEPNGLWRKFSSHRDTRTPWGLNKGAIVFSYRFTDAEHSEVCIAVIFDNKTQGPNQRLCKVVVFNLGQDIGESVLATPTGKINSLSQYRSTNRLHKRTFEEYGFTTPREWIPRYLIFHLHELTSSEYIDRLRPPNRGPLDKLLEQLSHGVCDKSFGLLPNGYVVHAEIKPRFAWEKQISVLDISMHDVSREDPGLHELQ
jgi:hypothetical protein